MPARRPRLFALARATYVMLPLPRKLKLRLKDAVYRSSGTLFHEHPRYAAWIETHRPSPPSAVAATTEAVVTMPTPRPYALAAADGDWEWRDYGAMTQRIAAASQQSSKKRRKRRRLIDIGHEDLASAAGRVSLPDPTTKPDVSVIIPAFGQLKATIECLLSVAAAGSGRCTLEVIVADDASPDDTAEVLAGVPNLRIIRQARNVGFLRNCNAAAKQAQGRLLVFLNNDTQVTPGWLVAMTRVFDEEPSVGAVGPRLVYPDGRLQDAGTRVRRDGTVEMIGLNGVPEDKRWSYRREVDYVSGACLMVPRGLFLEMGGFDESLAPAYCEDLDLGLRLLARGLRCLYAPDAEVVHHLSLTSDKLAGFKIVQITRNAQTIAERAQGVLDQLDEVRIVSFYLPQFHPIEQNDLWWGPGFTEWANVTRAQPNFVGHYQPRLPADLGYYDLRLPNTLEKQWQLAQRYGIDAFCYYYYWFDGTRLLHRPLERLREADAAALPFCICWANENWTRRWDGLDDEVLIGQHHSAKDDIAVIRDIAVYMRNPAYLRVRGRPLVLVYRVELFPDFARTAERWRAECQRLGIGEIHLALVESFRFAGAGSDPKRYGCDAAVQFPAHYIPDTRPPSGELLNPDFRGYVASYADAAVRTLSQGHPGHKLYRGLLPGWDNTARRQNDPFILEEATPGAFQAWLEAVIRETKRDLQGDERLIFINAWNEWAEGAYLEPDTRFGHTFLEAIRNARDADRLVARDG
ncbi:MAG: glycoside hydrolase family 99-like domain-containing protein [Mycobacterium sp.]